MDRDITITNGGKNVPLNEFVQRVTINAVLGLLGSFDGIDTDDDIVLRISRRGKSPMPGAARERGYC